jgi:hypothetical protein
MARAGGKDFSCRQSFEVDDLLENNGANFEAIPADMCGQKKRKTLFLICNISLNPW